MRIIAVSVLVCLGMTGCREMRTFNVDSAVTLTQATPFTAHTSADVNTISDKGPLQASVLSVPGQQASANRVAVIDVDGVLLNYNAVGLYSMGENPVTVFQEKLLAAEMDPAVKAVVVRINSPGGGVAATDLMWRAVQDFRSRTHKPVVACLLDTGAGGGYYLAAGCDTIVALPTSTVGGIGVVLNLFNLEPAMEQWNVSARPIKSGDRIDMGNAARKMTPEEKTLLTDIAKEYHTHFIKTVQRGRPLVKADSVVFDGRVMSASKAGAEGLIDYIGYLPDAINVAANLAKSGPLAPVVYHRNASPLRSLYDTVPNMPIHANMVPISLPGLDRSKLPLFLYLWNADPTLARVNGV